MADTLDLLTLAEAKQVLDISPGDVVDDAQVAEYVTSASRLLDQWVGPTVRRTVTAEPYDDACGRGSIVLAQRPVTSITSITEDGTALTADDYLSGRYTPDPTLLDGILRRRIGDRDGLWSGPVEVTYVAGRYAATAGVDARFKRACAIVLQNLWAGTLASTQEFDPGGYTAPTTNFPAFAMPNAARDLLAGEMGTGQARRWGIA